MMHPNTLSPDVPNPVWVLDGSGRPVDHNQAAAKLLQRHPGLPDMLQRLVQGRPGNDTEGQVHLAEEGAPAPGLAWVSPTTAGYLVILRPDDDVPLQQHRAPGSTQDVAYSALLNQDVLKEISALRTDLSRWRDQAPPPPVAARLERVTQLLGTIELLASTQQAPDFSLGDIVSLPDLLQELIEQRPDLQATLTRADPAHAAASAPGTLFARRPWLLAALGTLLAHQRDRHPAAPLQLSIEHHEGFVTLHCRLGPATAGDAPAGLRPVVPPPALMLSLARHIIDLQGGQLEMPDPQTAHGRAGGFRLTLPTGTPPHGYASPACQQCIYPGLAKTFAKDLGRLLPRKPLHLRVSPEEMQLLEQLHQSLSLNTETYKEQSP